MEEPFRPGPIYEFPPFFTRQINKDTWQTQLQQWEDVILQWCRARKKWQLSTAAPVFANPRIQRGLRPEVIADIMSYLVDQGIAERLGNGDVYVYAYKPSELAYDLAHWATDTGHSGTVITFYELQEGELPGLEKFSGTDSYLLRKVVDIMAKKGDAAAMKEENEYVGLKLA